MLTCPRCGAPVRPPGRWSDAWTCAEHGGIAPLHRAQVPSAEALRQATARSRVPLWLPWPLPIGWLVTGLQVAGDEHTGPVATVLACSGPHPLLTQDPAQRAADLLLLAEQPGVGLGARLAGLPHVDPGGAIGTGAPHLELAAAGHETPLWSVPGDLVAAYVGEAAGVWLWALVWPASAGVLLLEQFELRDLRNLRDLPDSGLLLDLPFGALSPRLA